MQQMDIVLFGNTPSKKNSKQIIINKKTGKPMIISNKNYYNWVRDNKVLFADTEIPKWKYPVEIHIWLYRKSHHRFDWNNISQAITDFLVDVGVIEDDSAEYCIPIYENYYYDKENPRAEIIIKEIENEE